MKRSIARFDTRLPKEQKEFFEYAASLGGFRNLTDFIISSIDQVAKQIVERHNTILFSKKDQEIFFDAIMKAPKPNPRLKKAASRYKAALSK